MCELAHVEGIIEAAFCDKLVVASFFDDVTVLHNEDHIRFLNGGKSVGDNEACSALHELREGFLYPYFGTGIY